MKREEAEALIDRYLAGNSTPEERRLIEGIYTQTAERAGTPTSHEEVQLYRERIKAELDRMIASEATQPQRRLTRWLPYAAAVLLVASVVGYFAVESQKSAVLPTGQAGASLAAADIQPGGNRATLTLADGRTINLDEAQTGIVVGAEDITYDDGTALEAVILSGEGEVSRGGVEGSLPNSGDASVMLALTTPKGGTYQITLPDGSKVWLNSASTLKYPSRFSGDSREVVLEGEAYFDVVSMDRARIIDARERSGSGTRDTRAPSALELDAGSRASVMRAPFKVKTNGQTVEVLGTEFNISAYADETETKTTLVTGRVRVAVSPLEGGRDGLSGGRGVIKELKPGEQSTTNSSAIQVNEVDTAPFIAWKDGLIAFHHTDLPTILRQIGRWYDVEFDTAGVTLTSETLYGEIQRDVPLSQVLHALQQSTGYTFTLTGRRVMMSQ